MEQPVFLLEEAAPDPAQPEALRYYRNCAEMATRAYGGIPIASYDVEIALDSAAHPSRFAVISFPNRQAIRALFEDPAYQALIPHRDKAYHHIRYFVVNEKL